MLSWFRKRRVFLSHSSEDKALAYRVAWRLQHRGIVVWIDQSEMAPGDPLSPRLKRAIQKSSHLVVIVTENAVASKWVAREMEFARAHARNLIIPLIVTRGIKWQELDQSLGLDFSDPLKFEERLDEISAIVRRRPRGAYRDKEQLRRTVEAISSTYQELRGLIQSLNQGRITEFSLAAVQPTEELRHTLETTLISLYELADQPRRHLISLVAARFYTQRGIGYAVLIGQIKTEAADPEDVRSLLLHLGTRFDRTFDFQGAFNIFTLPTTRPDQAFKFFVEHNFDRFKDSEKELCVDFCVSPDRGPGGFAMELAFLLLERLPDNKALRSLWWSWVHEYKFGGDPQQEAEARSAEFYSWMNLAVERSLKQFEPVMEHFQYRFRNLLRSGNIKRVKLAMGLFYSAYQHSYVRRAELTNELWHAIHSSEWKKLDNYLYLYGEISELITQINASPSYKPELSQIAEIFRAGQ